MKRRMSGLAGIHKAAVEFGRIVLKGKSWWTRKI
jgi:hypothetical protein